MKSLCGFEIAMFDTGAISAATTPELSRLPLAEVLKQDGYAVQIGPTSRIASPIFRWGG